MTTYTFPVLTAAPSPRATAADNVRGATVLAAKITVPARRTGAVMRTALLERLNLGRTRTRLTAIVAPAGFGKTTLARQWCLTGTTPIAWVSLDAGENDPSRFLTYLTMAVRTVHPDFGAGVLSLLHSPQLPEPEVLLTTFLNDLYNLGTPLTLVLDDYHLIHERAVHDMVAYLLDHLPESVHLVLATRVDPPLPLSRLRARGELTEIRVAELRCTGQDVSSFLGDVMGLQLTPSQTLALSERTEGWMAGLQLAALSLQHRRDPEAFITAFTGSNRYIVDYLGEEVLEQQPLPIRRFLQATAILERLSGPLCEAVAGDLGAGQGQMLLEQIETANLFLVPLDDDRRWFRYHHLFGDMLRARLAQEAGSEIPELHRRAACWYEGARMPEEAIHHALAGEHFEMAVRLMEQNIETVWMRGEEFTAQRWLAALPEEVVCQSATLLLFRLRFAVIAADPDRMCADLEQVERLLDRCEEDPYLRGHLTALQAFHLSFTGEDDRAIVLAEKALALLPPDSLFVPSVARILLTTIYMQRGQIEKALALCQEAVTDSEKRGDAQLIAFSRSLQASLLEGQGRLIQAQWLYRRALDALTVCRLEHLPVAAYALNGLASVAFSQNDLVTARCHATEALRFSRESGSADSFLRAAHLCLHLHHRAGEKAETVALLAEIDTFAASRTLRHCTAIAAGYRAWCDLANGNLPAAQLWEADWRSAANASDDTTLLYALYNQPGPPTAPVGEMLAFNLVRLRLLENRPEAARALLRTLREYLARQEKRGAMLEAALLLAVAEEQCGNRTEALVLVADALRTVAPENHVLPFLTIGETVICLLQALVTQDLEATLAAEMLKHFALPPSPQTVNERPLFASRLLDPLTDREIEVLQLVAAGLSNADIADRLFLSVGTVKRHVHNIFGKLEADSRVSAIAKARELAVIC